MRQHPQFCSIKCASLLLRAPAEAKQNQLDLSHGLSNIPNLWHFLSYISDISVPYKEVWRKSESNTKYESPRSLQEGLNGVYLFLVFFAHFYRIWCYKNVTVYSYSRKLQVLIWYLGKSTHNHISHKTKAEQPWTPAGMNRCIFLPACCFEGLNGGTSITLNTSFFGFVTWNS